MGIFLRHSYNVKPPRWGSPADVQYAIKTNAEKIYQVDPDSIVLAMPLFWGLPPLDYSGNRNDGINHGATYKDGSLDFDGVDDYVDCGDNASLEFTSSNSQMTILSWIKPFTTTGDRAILAKYDSQNDEIEYAFFIDSTHTELNFWISEDGTAYAEKIWKTSTADGVINFNQLQQVVVTLDLSTNTVKYYIDSIEYVPTNDQLTGIIDMSDLTEPVRIGAMRCGAGNICNFFKGIIPEVRIANVVRTADQIALFHDLPYGLYQPVSRPVYFFQAAVGVTMPIFMSNHLRQMGA